MYQSRDSDRIRVYREPNLDRNLRGGEYNWHGAEQYLQYRRDELLERYPSGLESGFPRRQESCEHSAPEGAA